METIKKIDIDYSDISGAISSVDELSNRVKDLNKDTSEYAGNTSKILDGLNKSTSVLVDSMESLKNSINGVFTSLGKLVSRFATLRNTIVGAVGAALFTAAGTTRENTQGSALNIGWAGAKAKENADDLLGMSPDFASARDAVSSYDTKGPLASLGITQTEASELYEKGADAAYFEIAKRYEQRLRDLIDEAGGDRAVGIQNFGAIYGEGLSQTLGTNAGDFSALALNGQLQKYKNVYYEHKQEYGGVNTSNLIEGEKHLNSFMSKLKVLTLTLSAELMPAINKIMGPTTEFLKNLVKWAKESEGLKASFKLISNFVEFIINIVKSAIDTLENSTFGDFIAKNAAGFSNSLQTANQAMEKGESGVVAFAKSTWNEQQKVGKALNDKNSVKIEQYNQDKEIRRTIREEKGFVSKEYLKSTNLHGEELKQFAQSLNISITLKDSKGNTVDTMKLNTLTSKGQQPVINLTQR